MSRGERPRSLNLDVRAEVREARARIRIGCIVGMNARAIHVCAARQRFDRSCVEAQALVEEAWITIGLVGSRANEKCEKTVVQPIIYEKIVTFCGGPPSDERFANVM